MDTYTHDGEHGASDMLTHGRSLIEIQIGSNRHPKELMTEIMNIVRRTRSESAAKFGPVTNEELSLFTIEAKRLEGAYGVPVSADSLVSLHTMETSFEAKKCNKRLIAARREISAAYRAGSSVLSISTRLRLPPIAVLRQILAAEGYEAKVVNTMIEDPLLMPARLASEAQEIVDSDAGSRHYCMHVAARAQEYENSLVSYLRNTGAAFRTEDEIKFWTPKNDPAPLTPDVLFDTPILVNGHLVHWMDAKAYPWYGSPLVAGKIAKQANKYIEAFGMGAFVFKGGVGLGTYVASPVLLLDGSHIG